MNAGFQGLSQCRRTIYTIVPRPLCTPLAELADTAFQLAVVEQRGGSQHINSGQPLLKR
jgi:hypothetical protein